MLRMSSFGSASFATISVSFGGQFFREGLFKNHGTQHLGYTIFSDAPLLSRKLASASWSLLALASIPGAAQGHHVIFHAKSSPPPHHHHHHQHHRHHRHQCRRHRHRFRHRHGH